MIKFLILLIIFINKVNSEVNLEKESLIDDASILFEDEETRDKIYNQISDINSDLDFKYDIIDKNEEESGYRDYCDEAYYKISDNKTYNQDDHDSTDSNGIIITGKGEEMKYKPYLNCKWPIVIPPKALVAIRLMYIQLETYPSDRAKETMIRNQYCRFDNLTVLNHYNPHFNPSVAMSNRGKYIAQYCHGENNTPFVSKPSLYDLIIYSSTGRILIEFKTDADREYLGFKLIYKFINWNDIMDDITQYDYEEIDIRHGDTLQDQETSTYNNFMPFILLPILIFIFLNLIKFENRPRNSRSAFSETEPDGSDRSTSHFNRAQSVLLNGLLDRDPRVMDLASRLVQNQMLNHQRIVASSDLPPSYNEMVEVPKNNQNLSNNSSQNYLNDSRSSLDLEQSNRTLAKRTHGKIDLSMNVYSNNNNEEQQCVYSNNNNEYTVNYNCQKDNMPPSVYRIFNQNNRVSEFNNSTCNSYLVMIDPRNNTNSVNFVNDMQNNLNSREYSTSMKSVTNENSGRKSNCKISESSIITLLPSYNSTIQEDENNTMNSNQENC